MHVWFDRNDMLSCTVKHQNQREGKWDGRRCSAGRGHTGSVGGACGLCEGGVCHTHIVVGAFTNDVGVHADR
jgi:hypothetical protein